MYIRYFGKLVRDLKEESGACKKLGIELLKNLEKGCGGSKRKRSNLMLKVAMVESWK